MDSVGAQTRDFILKSLSTNTTTIPPAGLFGNLLTTVNPNVKIIPTHKADGTWTTWNDIVNLWGINKLPHVIVHSNAGWGDASYNGPTTVGAAEGPIWALFDSAVAHYIGIAEVGDDAAWLATNTFGFTLTNNMPPPINDGTQYTAATDSLLVGLHPSNDHLLDSTKYPYLNGVVRNTAYTVLKDSTLYFKPYINGDAGGKDTIRCQADADKYTILPGQASKLTMLGFENCSHNGARVIPAIPDSELDVVVAFQDTITKNGAKIIRRAVALSIEPQFLKKTQALYQLTYDAIMYASLAWQNRPPSQITMTVNPNVHTLPAGDSISFTAVVTDGVNPVSGYDQSVKWKLFTWIPPAGNPVPITPGGTYLEDSNGVKNVFKAVDAYTTYIIKSSLDTIVNGILDTIRWYDTVYVAPGPATHLNIEASSDSMASRLNDARLGVLTLSSTTLFDSVYAVLRDQFGNWVSHATLASWLSRNTGVVTATPGNTQLGQGVIQRQTPNNATTYITATQTGFTDSLQVTLSNVTYSSVQIYVLSPGIKSIDTLRMRTDQDTTLHVRALRADGSGIYDDNLSFIWANTPGMQFNRAANGSLWDFTPQIPDTGIIYVALNSGGVGGVPLYDTVRVFFTNGLPNRMALYPQKGQPDTGTNVAFNAGATVTATAGVPFTIVANLFDNKGKWLNAYQAIGQPFTWTSSDATVGSLDSLHGYITHFTGRKAYSITTITATFVANGVPLTQSINIYVVPGPANHLTLESDTSRLTSPNADNRAVRISIDSSATTAMVYAILRDQFGNWVGYSSRTGWSTADTTKAIAAAGITTIGQGIITREANTGQTTIYAVDSNHAGFEDSVIVVLSTVTYDSLRIVVAMGDSVKIITNLTMRTDQDTILQVQGRRSDTKTWEPVPGNWSISPQIKTTPAPALNATFWGEFTPNDTGRGTITVTYQKAVPASIPFTFTHGLPSRIAIYPGSGAPSASNSPYPGPATAIIDTAGKPLTLVIKVFDQNNVWLNSYEGDTTTDFNWNIQELTGIPPTGSLGNVIGYKSSFNPQRAYNTIYIIATFNATGAKYFDTIQVQVVPGAPKQLVIEANQNWQTSPNKANPVDSIQINSSETYRDVYAIVRDSLGNFIKYSLQTAWISINSSGTIDTSVVSVQNGTNSIGQGIVKRVGAEGTARVIATSKEYPGLADTIRAIVVKYFYRQLRIVSNVNVTTRMGTLTMSTNDDTTLYVIGLRSDDSLWEPVSAEWDTSALVHVAPSAPERALSWSFSPVTPDTGFTGWIRVTLGIDTTTKPDTVFVNFTPGAPTSITINLITPASQIIAGDTVVAVVSIRNKDGLYPGQKCDTTSYQEMLGNGGNGRPNPIVIVDDSTSVLKQGPVSATATHECFQNGLDTVKYVFYYAPVDKQDSTQQIFVTLNNLSASTPAFNVLPSSLSSLAIQTVNGKNLDTVNLAYPDGAQVFVAVGFDAYGNKVDLTNGAVWTQTNTLHAIDKPTNVTRIYYDASAVTYNEQGYIRATVTDINGKKVQDSAYVSIIGKPTTLVAAVTQDVNGDGYLDGIVLHFDKQTTIPAGYNIDSLINVTYNYAGTNFTFTVDSIGGVPSNSGVTSQSATDSVFTIYVSELKNNIPQTAWTPSVTINGLTGTTPVNNVTSVDGAGPVIWSVTKDITSLTNRATDLVSITFSEPIEASDGSDFKNKLSTDPSLVFYVWKDSAIAVNGKAVKDTFVLDTILNGINGFYSVSSDGKTVYFYMSNGKDLTSEYYISLKSDSSLIVDLSRALNDPAKTNQKVQVKVISNAPNVLTVGPNPAVPSYAHPGDLTLDYNYNYNARQWAVDGNGTLLSFDVAVSTNSNDKITGYIKIYDVVGNLVCGAGDNGTNLIQSSWIGSGTVQHYYIYWNGLNARKTKAAPGVYSAILYLTKTS
ncbi:MAG: hypothetical protein WBM07_08760, partial [Chitinivibrionales bacterium]